MVSVAEKDHSDQGCVKDDLEQQLCRVAQACGDKQANSPIQGTETEYKAKAG